MAARASLTVVLGRPTSNSVTASVLTSEAREGCIEFGTASGKYERRSALATFPAGAPVEVLLDKLTPNTRVFYRLVLRRPGENEFRAEPETSFHTQRAPGTAFTFEIQGDSHPERTPKQHNPVLYAQTLRAVAADRPDFYMTIGDDFSVDTLSTPSAAAVDRIYLNQRLCLSPVAQSAALFLVNGNHEQAALCNLDGTPNNVAVWAQTTRNKYFPQPAPDGFYAGDAAPVPHIGLLRDYCAWTWGGRNKRGEWEFAARRPGWEMPIHQLMTKNGVTIFFQGHDHIFVRQEKDGVVYQTLPDPADSTYSFHNREAYLTGDAFPGSGRVRVSVGPDKLRVEYLRSYLARDATPGHPDGGIAFAYEIPATKAAHTTQQQTAPLAH